MTRQRPDPPDRALHAVHLDTDVGSDTDDLCALAMLLGWPHARLATVTTNTDPGGLRAGMAAYALALAGRGDVPVIAGAEGTLAPPMAEFAFPDYWPEPIDSRPAPAGLAVEALEASAESGATIVAIGPYTNLAMLETARPGLLASTTVVVMGGHVTTPRDGYPRWGADDDFNVQQDRTAARIVLDRCDPVVVPLAATVEVWLRRPHLEPLTSSGALGRLLAHQAERHALDNDRPGLARDHPALPEDLLNFQHDPLACAVALGWDGAAVETIPTSLDVRGDRLRMGRGPDGRPLRVVTAVDGPRFESAWLDAVCRASARL